MIATAHRGLAALIATIGVALASSAAADQRYQIEACSGEKACAFIVPAGDAEITLEQLCAYLSEHRIAKTKLPEYMEIIDRSKMIIEPGRFLTGECGIYATSVQNIKIF